VVEGHGNNRHTTAIWIRTGGRTQHIGHFSRATVRRREIKR
jgi:hypothetical protein